MKNSPQPWLPPVVISLKANAKIGEYICQRTQQAQCINHFSTQTLYLKHTDGLRNPTGPFPISRRASLIRVIIDPTTGEEQEVPKTSSNSPSIPVRDRKNDASGPGKEHTNDVVCTCCLRGHFSYGRISRENSENVPVSRQIWESARLHRKIM